MLGFLIGGVTGFVSGFVLGVDYGRRHSEPWRDLGDTGSEFVTWARRTFAGGPMPPTPGDPVTVQTSAGPVPVMTMPDDDTDAPASDTP